MKKMRDTQADHPDAFATKNEGAYWRLRADIIEGTLAPSIKLPIELLKATYGFGASSLREALSRLVSDGLVEAEGQRGFWVAPISREELGDITIARKIVEVGALRQSIEHGSIEWEARVIAARHSLDRLEKSMTTHTQEVVLNWERANRQFHMELLSDCPSKWLLRSVSMLYDQALRYRHRTKLRRAIPRAGVSSDHNSIVEAALGHDAELACRLLSDHIDATWRSTDSAIFGNTAGKKLKGRA
jgi:GntR family transcriptional regulator, carbon starvation induced regulator